jgi:hypothetical protein
MQEPTNPTPTDEELAAMADELKQLQDGHSIYWLATCTVYYRVNTDLKNRKVNVLISTITPNITESVIGNIQVAAQKQVVDFNKMPKAGKIADIIIDNLSMLGVMPKDAFHDLPRQSQPAPANS